MGWWGEIQSCIRKILKYPLLSYMVDEHQDLRMSC